MYLDIFVKPLLELAEVGEIRERMQKGKGVLARSGCLDAQKAHILYGLTFDKDISSFSRKMTWRRRRWRRIWPSMIPRLCTIRPRISCFTRWM